VRLAQEERISVYEELMLTVRSQDKFDEFADLDPATGFMQPFQVSGNAAETIETSGWYSQLAGQLVSLFAFAGDLYLRLNEKPYRLDESRRVEYSRHENESNLTLLERGQIIATLSYAPVEISPPLDEDPTGFIDEEDFDFGLFLSNVLENPARREILLKRTRVEL
jgi:hypothetical protein